MDQVRKKRTRSSHPKVKTGCIDCKKRHVKCDEQRPACSRCLNFDGHCSGYDRPPAHTVCRSLRPLACKEEAAQLLIIPIPISNTPFQNNEEYHYFQFFCSQTSRDLSGYFDDKLWNHIILQACDSDPGIRRAATAIAALYQSLLTAHTNSNSSWQGIEDQEVKRHHDFALLEYSRALQDIRKVVSSGEQPLRTTLITCLLLICFESLHGDHEAAIVQVQTGLNLIFEWRQSLPPPSYTQTRIWNNSANLAVANPDLEQETLSNGLDKLSCIVTEPRPVTLSRPYFTSPEPYVVSPAPYVLEKELLQAFMQKDAQARTFCYWRPQIKHLRNLFSGPTQPTINTGMIASTHGTFGNSNEIIRGYAGYAELKSPVPIPPFFADLHEALSYATLLNNRFELLGRALSYAVGMGDMAAGSEYVWPSLLKIGECFGTELADWAKAFAPLREEAFRSGRGAGAARDLQIWYLATYLGLHIDEPNAQGPKMGTYAARELQVEHLTTCLSAHFANPKAQQPEWREWRNKLTAACKDVVKLSQELEVRPCGESGYLKKPSSYESRERREHLYVFDGRLIVSLYIVASKCQNWKIRREAIDLLFKQPRREALWDSTMAGKTAQWILQIEQDACADIPGWNMQSEWIPYQARVEDVEVKFDARRRTAYVRCLQPKGAEWVPRETVLWW